MPVVSFLSFWNDFQEKEPVCVCVCYAYYLSSSAADLLPKFAPYRWRLSINFDFEIMDILMMI